MQVSNRQEDMYLDDQKIGRDVYRLASDRKKFILMSG
jgi:hypothetical protein